MDFSILPDTWSSILASIFISLFTIAVLKIVSKLLNNSTVYIKDLSNSHSWREIRKSSEHPWWCNICESLLMNFEGFYCDSCGVASDSGCIKKANTELKCKPISSSNSSLKHHWVRGNLREIEECKVCQEECGVEAGLVDWRCAWCQLVTHPICKLSIDTEDCDLGVWSKYIVSPLDVELNSRGRAILPLHNRTSSTSLFVVGNIKSGSGEVVKEVLSSLRRYLNGGVQVVGEVERWGLVGDALGEEKGVAIAVGGDGTASSLLSLLRSKEKGGRAAIGVLPLGTGNDLSRTLGWGSSLPRPFSPPTFFSTLSSSTLTQLDRWAVEFKQGKRKKGKGKKLFMYNYLSIGVDAKVTLDFHNTRKSPLYPPGSSLLNKMLYLCFGTQQVVERHCQGLEERIEICLDGAPSTPLPPLEAIVVLNIPYWGAGVKLWPDEDQSMNDGILEVIGIYSSFHIAQLQVGLSKPHIIGQASTIKIKLKGRDAVQVDGEPWMENPTEMTITRDSQATVLVAPHSMTSPKK